MARVDTTERPARPARVTEYRVERGVGGAMEPAERIATEIRMLIDPRCDQRMRDLQQDGRRASEDEEELAVETPRHRVARKDADVGHTRSVGLLWSFRFAFEGVSYLIRTQRNARIEIAIGAAVLLLAAYVRVSPVEWAVLILTIALVLCLEAINTAIEVAVTLASPERHALAKAAKDVSAAAVLVAAIASVLVGIAVFRPYLSVLGY